MKILNRYNNNVIFEDENGTIIETVLNAIKSEADLSEANLSKADLSAIKSDMFYKMLFAPKEIPALREELINGRINGTSYSGDCACFCGTIANKLEVDCERELQATCGIKPDGSSLIERWFLAIREGNTPENNQVAKITLEWIDEFLMLTQRIRDGKEL